MVPRVLVVQPREALARTTGRVLRGAGFETTLVPDGDAAVRAAVTDPPAAVLVDLTLPVLDGWLVLSALGARRARPRLVAYAPPGDAARALALGADACVHDRGAAVAALRRVTAGALAPA
ncbi:MAG: hypothetical protein KatS3mg009_0055 [Acidimicrobiia bacterium]|nr:MAG: hypothetical protein KatS3mg009_0055 [Acidimicrobiia bacterium]